jgi:hypothetical protein
LIFTGQSGKPRHRFGGAFSFGATWRNGYARLCKSLYPGSIPGVASNRKETGTDSGTMCPIVYDFVYRRSTFGALEAVETPTQKTKMRCFICTSWISAVYP